ncbi:MAG: hypothetical protein QG656_2008 [Candidatus Hydrogenedentes bacterium]|nr:hypothetical protein [Candidatus Hydrogenedentota bacterium]
MSEQTGSAWKCLVCGYVHRGPEPPEFCPVCGADRDEFQPFAEAPAPAHAPVTRWSCLNCNYMHAGSEPPAQCPVCDVAADRFTPVADEGGHARGGARTKVVVIGGGIAGVSAVESIRETAPDAEVVLIAKELEVPYYRLNLTRYVAGEIGRETLPIHPESWYREQNIGLRLGVQVTAVDLEGHRVSLDDGSTESYEKLIIATGAHPFMPPIAGASRQGVMKLRTADEADALIAAAASGARCVCVGGGVLGLETAGGLARRGGQVTVLESFPWLLPRQLNAEAAAKLAKFLESLHIAARMPVKVEEFVGDESVRGVKLGDGTVIPADMVVVAAGVRPNSYLGRLAGLEVNQGIVVDNHLRTSHPDVYAAGDVAEHNGVLYGTWSPSRYQGSIAGMNAVGGLIEFGGIPRSNTLKVLGLDLFSIGVVTPEDGSYTVLVQEDERTYTRFVFRDSHLVGSILLGDASLAAAVKTAVESKQDFSGLLEQEPRADDVSAYLKAAKG